MRTPNRPSSITLTWTRPGDDGTGGGAAATYDIRYRTDHAITTTNDWDTATPASGEPIPLAPPGNQSWPVPSLSASTTYYFAMKTEDEVHNWSGLSNSPSGQTTAPGTSGKLALKRDAGLVAGGAPYLDPRFDSGTNVATTPVQDAWLWNVQQDRWRNFGNYAESGGGSAANCMVTYKFDLAPVPAYAQIHLAQLRVHAYGGLAENISSLAMIYTHDWIEGTMNRDYPGAAGGITSWAPIAYNTDMFQTPSGAPGTTEDYTCPAVGAPTPIAASRSRSTAVRSSTRIPGREATASMT